MHNRYSLLDEAEHTRGEYLRWQDFHAEKKKRQINQ